VLAVGVTMTDAVITDAPELIPVNDAILPLPAPARPIDEALFVQL
jgi:hypothetical protein